MNWLGSFIFWCAWPLFWYIAPLTRRVRVVVEDNGKLLVVKNWIGPNRWDLPGGGIKRGETAETAAKRELMEELNLTAKTTTLLNTGEIVRSFGGLSMRVTFVKVTVENLDNINQNWEIIGTKWIDTSETSGLFGSERVWKSVVK